MTDQSIKLLFQNMISKTTVIHYLKDLIFY